MGDAAGSPLKPPGRPRVSGLFPSFRVDTELLAALKVLARYRRRRFILLAAGLAFDAARMPPIPSRVAGLPSTSGSHFKLPRAARSSSSCLGAALSPLKQPQNSPFALEVATCSQCLPVTFKSPAILDAVVAVPQHLPRI